MLLATLAACGVSTLDVDVPGDDSTVIDTGEPELDSGSDTGETGIEPEACEEYPEIPLYDGSPAEGEIWNPRWVMPGFVGAVDDGTIHDVVWEGEAFSSYLTFNIADEEGDRRCTIYYDLSESIPVGAPWATDTGGQLFEGWELVLREGVTDCPPIAERAWGVDDLRTLIEQHQWGWAFGEPVRISESMPGYVDDWETFWEPRVMGGYVQTSAYSQATAYEMAYGLAIESDCGVAVLDWNGDPNYLPALEQGPLTRAIWYGGALFAMDLEYLKTE